MARRLASSRCVLATAAREDEAVASTACAFATGTLFGDAGDHTMCGILQPVSSG